MGAVDAGVEDGHHLALAAGARAPRLGGGHELDVGLEVGPQQLVLRDVGREPALQERVELARVELEHDERQVVEPVDAADAHAGQPAAQRRLGCRRCPGIG